MLVSLLDANIVIPPPDVYFGRLFHILDMCYEFGD